MIKKVLLIATVVVASTGFCQQPSAAPDKKAGSGGVIGGIISSEPEADLPSLVRETQKIETRNNKIGMFWWIPTEFWEIGWKKQGHSSEDARKKFLPLRKYNLFLIAAGTNETGNIKWRTEEEVRKATVLFDSNGNIYRPIEVVPLDIQSLLDTLKPTLKAMQSSFRESSYFLLFPTTDPAESTSANSLKPSEISMQVRNLMGPSANIYAWRLPLSSLSPPKYCPVGKEQLEPSWRYCPWHGIKLPDEATEQPAATPANSK
jgi:hypothetical protein